LKIAVSVNFETDVETEEKGLDDDEIVDARLRSCAIDDNWAVIWDMMNGVPGPENSCGFMKIKIGLSK